MSAYVLYTYLCFICTEGKILLPPENQFLTLVENILPQRISLLPTDWQYNGPWLCSRVSHLWSSLRGVYWKSSLIWCWKLKAQMKGIFRELSIVSGWISYLFFHNNYSEMKQLKTHIIFQLL